MKTNFIQFFFSNSIQAEAAASEIGLYAAARNFVTGGSFELFAVAVLFMIVLLMIILGLVSSPHSSHTSGPLYRMGLGPSAKNLFLFISYDRWECPSALTPVKFLEMKRKLLMAGDLPPTETLNGYLRRLSVSEALIVSSNKLSKGDFLKLHIGILPGYPDSKSILTGQVKSCRKIQGDPNHFYVTINIGEQESSDRHCLLSFIRGLTKKPSAFSRL